MYNIRKIRNAVIKRTAPKYPVVSVAGSNIGICKYGRVVMGKATFGRARNLSVLPMRGRPNEMRAIL